MTQKTRSSSKTAKAPRQKNEDVPAAAAQARAKPTRARSGDTAKPKAARRQRRPVKDRGPSKAQACLNLLRQSTGASLADLQAATGWQPHSVRGFLSGTVRKKLGLNLISEKSADGTRRYSVLSTEA